jgi:hypothetical protein
MEERKRDNRHRRMQGVFRQATGIVTSIRESEAERRRHQVGRRSGWRGSFAQAPKKIQGGTKSPATALEVLNVQVQRVYGMS